jgi:hypothetical protein
MDSLRTSILQNLESGFHQEVIGLVFRIVEQLELHSAHSVDSALEEGSPRATPHQKAEVICSDDSYHLSMRQQGSAYPCRRRMLVRPNHTDRADMVQHRHSR